MFCIDQLGKIKAHISALEKQADHYKAEIISAAAQVEGTAWAEEGETFRACVSWADKAVVDYKSAFAELVARHGMQEAFVTALLHKYTKVAPMVPTVRVSARKTGG